MLLATPLTTSELRGLGRAAYRRGIQCYEAPRWAADSIARHLTAAERVAVMVGWGVERAEVARG